MNVLLTGASSGLGIKLARKLLEEDNFVIWSIEDGKIVLDFIEDDTIDMKKLMADQPWDANNK